MKKCFIMRYRPKDEKLLELEEALPTKITDLLFDASILIGMVQNLEHRGSKADEALQAALNIIDDTLFGPVINPDGDRVTEEKNPENIVINSVTQHRFVETDPPQYLQNVGCGLELKGYNVLVSANPDTHGIRVVHEQSDALTINPDDISIEFYIFGGIPNVQGIADKRQSLTSFQRGTGITIENAIASIDQTPTVFGLILRKGNKQISIEFRFLPQMGKFNNIIQITRLREKLTETQTSADGSRTVITADTNVNLNKRNIQLEPNDFRKKRNSIVTFAQLLEEIQYGTRNNQPTNE